MGACGVAEPVVDKYIEHQSKGRNMIKTSQGSTHRGARSAGFTLLASICAGGFAAGCATEPQDDDPGTGEAQQAVVQGRWTSPPGNGVVLGAPGDLGRLTICRADYDGGQQPGKGWEGACNFGFGGLEIRSYTYQVLLDDGYRWIATGSLPDNAVDGGDAGFTAHDVRLGVCQAFQGNDNSWHPGKLYAGKCNIAWGGREIAVSPNPRGDVLVLVK